MKTQQEVTAEKLRGGFYTPPKLVDFCLDRIANHLGPETATLEPSIGDGAFVHGLERRGGKSGVARVFGLEPFEIEAGKARRSLADAGVSGEVLTKSAVEWAAHASDSFDAAFGNPPFVRYQFIPKADRAAADQLADRLGLSFRGVSNLWIPVFLGALSRVRRGGVFAFVIPTECLTGCSARVVRDWLTSNCNELRFDIFEPGSFPDVLQEVAVVSGSRGSGSRTIRVADHSRGGGVHSWSHEVSANVPTWTRYLLQAEVVAAISALETEAEAFDSLGNIAPFEVSTVTGANNYFTVNGETLSRYELGHWRQRLLPRIRHAHGLRFDATDHETLSRTDARAWLLHFSASRRDPQEERSARRYLRLGRERNLHGRYKCRIRKPWYRVPVVEPGQLLLSKRSHHFPRVVVNEAGVYTTDTIYQGRMRRSDLSPRALAAGFHNSLTLLTAELEGRSFGGGVLELVPSEVARLIVPVIPSLDQEFTQLDALLRAGKGDQLVPQTNQLLSDAGAISRDTLATIEEARQELLRRRLARNQRTGILPSTDALEKAA